MPLTQTSMYLLPTSKQSEDGRLARRPAYCLLLWSIAAGRKILDRAVKSVM